MNLVHVAFNIIVYAFFAFVLSYYARKSDSWVEDNELSPACWDKYLTYFVVFYTLICAVRWNVGGDHISYCKIFANGDIVAEEKEKLWNALVRFVHDYLHWIIGIAICAFLQIFFIVKSLQPYRWLLIWVPFALFGGRYWMDLNGAIRQMIVACGFLWASKFIVERKIWYYLGFVAIGSMIHASAILLVVFYFIPLNRDLTQRRWLLTAILVVCFFLGLTPAFQNLVGYFQLVSDTSGYEYYTQKMSDMLLAGNTSEALSFGPMMLSYLIIPLYLIWLGPELKQWSEGRLPLFNIWFNLAWLYACAYFLICNISHLFIRPLLYFSLFQMVMAALCLAYLCSEWREYGKRQILTYAFCFILALNTAWDVYKATGSQWEISTYKTILFNSQLNKFGL